VSAYIKYFDNRYGDLYEVYFNEETGEFEGAVRSIGVVGLDPVYYEYLSELPPYHRNQIEHLIWKRLHPPSKPQESSPNEE
jgi:hypothetical protein